MFFTRPKAVGDAQSEPKEMIFTCGSKPEPLAEQPGVFRDSPAFRHLFLADKHWFWSRPEKATQFCRIERSGKGWKADHGAIYNGHLVPLAKALVSRQKTVGPRSARYGYAWLWVPIVATTAPLYVVSSTTAPTECQLVTQVTLMRSFSGNTLNGRFCYEFVSVPALRSFVEGSVQPFVESLVTIAKTDVGRLFCPPQRSAAR